jgi:hypothetical protein
MAPYFLTRLAKHTLQALLLDGAIVIAQDFRFELLPWSCLRESPLQEKSPCSMGPTHATRSLSVEDIE